MIDHHQTLKSLASLVKPSMGSELKKYRQKGPILIIVVQLQSKWKHYI